MTTLNERAAPLLSLPDERYFDFDDALQTELQRSLSALTREKPTPSPQADAPPGVLVLGAPRRVRPDEHNILPVLVGSVRTGLRDWQVNFNVNLQLFVRDVESGHAFVCKPLVNMRRGRLELRSGAGDPPPLLEAQSLISAVSRVNLRERFPEAPAPGRYAVTAASSDWRSNTVQFVLEGEAVAPRREPAAPQPYLRYSLDRSNHPEPKVELPSESRAGEPLHLRVAMSVGAGSGVQAADSAQAMWPVNVLLVKLDERALVLPLHVPVQPISAIAGAPRFTAAFDVDLTQASSTPLSGQYQLYLDAGDHLLGPYPMAVRR
jgi:hypothetical protein